MFIEKAKQLKVPDGQTVDPLVEVCILNEKKFTSAKDDISGTGLCNWNEHLFFEPKAVVRGFGTVFNSIFRPWTRLKEPRSRSECLTRDTSRRP